MLKSCRISHQALGKKVNSKLKDFPHFFCLASLLIGDSVPTGLGPQPAPRVPSKACPCQPPGRCCLLPARCLWSDESWALEGSLSRAVAGRLNKSLFPASADPQRQRRGALLFRCPFLLSLVTPPCISCFLGSSSSKSSSLRTCFPVGSLAEIPISPPAGGSDPRETPKFDAYCATQSVKSVALCPSHAASPGREEKRGARCSTG